MRKKTQVSLKQIAEATDLSITTVSRVLRQQGEISDETRKRVLKVAKELNYRPNLLIQGIQTGRTGNVGVMVPPYNPYWAEILKGIHDELVENDYAPVALWDESILAHDNREEFMLKQMHRLIDRRVDGVILWPKVSEVYGAHLDELESRELPVVTIDHELEFADSVVTDEQLGAELVARHLYSQGHRYIGHLAGDPHWTWAQQRRTYFEAGLRQYPDASCITMVGSDDADKVPGIARMLLSLKPRPTAIFACSDWVAYEIYAAAAEMGLTIPDDLSVVGYSDDTSRMSLLIHPALTTIRQKPYPMGQEAARLLMERVNKINTSENRVRTKMGCELTIRNSTRKL